MAYLKSRLLLPDPEPEQNDEIIDMTMLCAISFCGSKHAAGGEAIAVIAKIGPTRYVRGAPEQFAASVNLNGPHLYMIFWLVMVIFSPAARQKL